jgi:HSP20 family protein
MTNLAKFLDHNEIEPFDVMFRDFFNTRSFFLPATESDFHYPVDIHEDDKSLNIEIAAVGLDKNDIKIEEEDGVLSVSYNKEETLEERDNKEYKLKENRNYIKRGITRKSFNMGWKISDKFNVKKIEAEMDKGLLKITIPRTEEKLVSVKNTIKIN